MPPQPFRPLQPVPQEYITKEEIIVPLTGAAASVKIIDFIAEVTIKQRYENKEKTPIEAVVKFILF